MLFAEVTGRLLSLDNASITISASNGGETYIADLADYVSHDIKFVGNLDLQDKKERKLAVYIKGNLEYMLTNYDNKKVIKIGAVRVQEKKKKRK